MADIHSYDVTIDGVDYVVDSDHPLTDQDAYQAAQSQHAVSTFDVKKQNAVMRANMARQPAGTGERGLLEDFATSGPVGDINESMGDVSRGNYAGAAHKAIKGIGTILAPAALPAIAAAPAAAIGGLMLGVGGTAAGRGAASLVTDNPDYIDLAGDVGGFAGGAAGAKLGAASPSVIGRGLELAGGAVEKAPSLRQLAASQVKRAGVRLQGPAPESPVVPVADVTASRPSAAVPGRQAIAPLAGHTPPSPVVPIADASATSSTLRPSAMAAGREPYAPAPEQPDVRSLVVSNADAAASHPGARMADLTRQPYNLPPEPPPALPTPKATTGEIMRDQRMLAQAEKRRTAQLADRAGQIADAEEQAALAKLPNKRNVSNMEVVNEGATPNASGESAASAEALSRLSSMKAKGESFAVLKGGKLRKLVGPESVDYAPQAGERYGIIDKDGSFRVLSQGTRSGALSTEEARLIGNHGAGALTLAERKALLAEMLNRKGQ